MRILPVIDLMGGRVVRGVAGNRQSYRPIESRLVGNCKPAVIGRALAETLGATQAYVADLDAIAGAEPARKTYAELLACGLSLWIDAGLGDVEHARKLAEFEPAVSAAGADRPAITGIIAGLESLADENSLIEIRDVVRPERLVFSLDLKSGRPLARFEAWQQLAPIEIALAAIRLGVRRMIVLDLAGVGMNDGVPTLVLCRAIRTAAPDMEITSGGGVRGVDDLEALAEAGCDRALVASALHDGRLSIHDVRRFMY